jgi:hypothetical protein
VDIVNSVATANPQAQQPLDQAKALEEMQRLVGFVLPSGLTAVGAATGFLAMKKIGRGKGALLGAAIGVVVGFLAKFTFGKKIAQKLVSVAQNRVAKARENALSELKAAWKDDLNLDRQWMALAAATAILGEADPDVADKLPKLDKFKPEYQVRLVSLLSKDHATRKSTLDRLIDQQNLEAQRLRLEDLTEGPNALNAMKGYMANDKKPLERLAAAWFIGPDDPAARSTISDIAKGEDSVAKRAQEILKVIQQRDAMAAAQAQATAREMAASKT